MIRAEELHEVATLLNHSRGLPDDNVLNQEYFPLTALPPFLQHVVAETQGQSQAACSSCAIAVLTTIAAAFQARTSVQVRGRPPFPISLYAIVLAASGERKSSLLSVATSSLRAFDAAERERHKTAAQSHEAIEEIFRSKSAGLRKALMSDTAKGHPTAALEEKLHELLENKPSKPRQLRATMEKISAHSLLKHFAEEIACSSAITDEAMHLFSGSMSRNFGFLNKIYDGASTNERSALGEFYVENPRFSLGVWGQTEIVEKYINANDLEARTSGFLARCFVIKPPAIAGQRRLQRNLEAPPGDAIKIFDDICYQELESVSPTLSKQPFTSRVLKLSENATEAWTSYYNSIEECIGGIYEFRNFADLASKQADKTARIAALIHIFDDSSDYISERTMRSAIEISQWLFKESSNIISPPVMSEIEKNANNLYNWLSIWLKTNYQYNIRKRDLMKLGPMATRKSQALEPALQYLVQNRRAWVGVPTGEKTCFVGLNY